MHCFFTARLAGLLPLVAAACGSPGASEPQIIEVVAVDYAFQAPRVAGPGAARFRFMNRGSQFHEVQLFRFLPGIGPDSVRTLLALEEFPDSLVESAGAVLFAPPGGTTPEELFAVLDTSHVWALRCGFRDGPDAPRHNQMGMYSILTVASGRQ